MIMRLRKPAVLAFAAAMTVPAMASASDDISALLDGGFAYNDTHTGADQHADQYSMRGSALFSFDNPGLGLQLDGANDWYADPTNGTSHLWSGGADAFWRDGKGTIGLSASYFRVDQPAFPFFRIARAIESYGFFGEYYASSDLTVQIKGGGTTGATGAASLYGGGGLTYYDSPDLAFHTEMNFNAYTSGRDWTSIDSNVEYLPFGSFPLSLYAGYDWTNFSAAGYASTFFAGVKLRFGADRTLVGYHRSGPVEWTGNATPGANLKF